MPIPRPEIFGLKELEASASFFADITDFCYELPGFDIDDEPRLKATFVKAVMTVRNVSLHEIGEHALRSALMGLLHANEDDWTSKVRYLNVSNRFRIFNGNRHVKVLEAWLPTSGLGLPFEKAARASVVTHDTISGGKATGIVLHEDELALSGRCRFLDDLRHFDAVDSCGNIDLEETAVIDWEAITEVLPLTEADQTLLNTAETIRERNEREMEEHIRYDAARHAVKMIMGGTTVSPMDAANIWNKLDLAYDIERAARIIKALEQQMTVRQHDLMEEQRPRA